MSNNIVENMSYLLCKINYTCEEIDESLNECINTFSSPDDCRSTKKKSQR